MTRTEERKILDINISRTKKEILKNIGYEIYCSDELGRGGFGVIYKCKFENSKYMAVKIAKTQDARDQEKAIDVFKIIKKLNHVNLVKIYELICMNDEIYTIMDLYSDGDISSYIKELRKVNLLIQERQAKILLHGLVRGLRHMHARRIVHRDIKPKNVLVVKDPLRSVIADFDLVKEVPDGITRLVYSCGTKHYKSPQILSGKSFDPYNADVWAVGCTLY